MFMLLGNDHHMKMKYKYVLWFVIDADVELNEVGTGILLLDDMTMMIE